MTTVDICTTVKRLIRLIFEVHLPCREQPVTDVANTILGRIRDHIYNPDAADKIGCRQCYDFYKHKEAIHWGTDEHQPITLQTEL